MSESDGESLKYEKEENEAEQSLMAYSDDDDDIAIYDGPINVDSSMSAIQRKLYLLAPSSNEWTSCTIDRIRTKGWNKLSRKYALFSENGTFLAMVEKKFKSKTANYMISADPHGSSTLVKHLEDCLLARGFYVVGAS